MINLIMFLYLHLWLFLGQLEYPFMTSSPQEFHKIQFYFEQLVHACKTHVIYSYADMLKRKLNLYVSNILEYKKLQHALVFVSEVYLYTDVKSQRTSDEDVHVLSEVQFQYTLAFTNKSAFPMNPFWHEHTINHH